MKSSGVELWQSPWPATWSLLWGVEQRPLSRLAREWWSHAKSIAESGAESWPLLWPQEVEQSCGHYCGPPRSPDGPGLLAEARLRYLAEICSFPSERSSDVAGEPSTVGCFGR